MMRDILSAAASDREDLEVLSATMPARGWVDAALLSGADAVVLGLAEGADLPTWGHALLGRRPAIKLFGVAGSGRQVFMYELRPQRVAVGEVSPDELFAAMRTALRDGDAERSASP
jgi:hypothetical protein